MKDDLNKMIKEAYKLHLPAHISDHQNNILFANFVNVSNEMSKRNLDK